MLFSTHSEETSKRHYGIGYATADLVDHQTLNAADIIALWVVDGGSFDSIALNERLPGQVPSGGVARRSEAASEARPS